MKLMPEVADPSKSLTVRQTERAVELYKGIAGNEENRVFTKEVGIVAFSLYRHGCLGDSGRVGRNPAHIPHRGSPFSGLPEGL